MSPEAMVQTFDSPVASPNTPLKRGETPMKRRSLVTHTATTALKKIIKVRPIASLLPSEDSHPCSSQE